MRAALTSVVFDLVNRKQYAVLASVMFGPVNRKAICSFCLKLCEQGSAVIPLHSNFCSN